ncbi:conserved hypothetical protein [Agrobacterium tumefaciens str. Kerr 14]|uniref:Uncharacterized protein n=1 Tax=Agrobacterium tumefaciens str. Kerr 14 TaxID=1183424 RepID=A0A1S7SC47_AGRTU|nr:restriction endonuclease [Agrobacterium tumefaciens]CUX66060.1 conserved hypothetical protein [Agrobacterium tumefaciens str. Kerr 14]
MDITSTVEKGNAFRDLVVSMLEAAGFACESEIRQNFKKVDAIWRRDDIDGSRLYGIETKDYKSALSKDECVKFAYEYGTLVDAGNLDSAWLVSRGEISPDGRAAIDAKRGLKAFTFAEFQRRLLGLDNYLRDLLGRYDNSRVADWYVHLHTDENLPLDEVVRNWLAADDLPPMAIIAGYGKGKSTFALNTAASLATAALKDADERAPILIPLGDIMDEQSLEGLLGKAFTTTSGVLNYNFALFEKLNHAGRFVILFDGFDEMKHGMTLQKFETMIRELLRLDRGRAKILILGRDTAFHDQHEFRAIIEGRQTTSAGFDVPTMDRRQFTPVTIRDFHIEEARSFVRGFFPSLMAEASKGGAGLPSSEWVEKRIDELVSGEFDTLLVRPVHARMLCQIATDPKVVLGSISKYGLFDRFVHFLLDREVSKRGRDPRFGIEARRKFNAQVALWLWRQAGASTVTLNHIPFQLCQLASKGIAHDYDEMSLRRELAQGCLVDKGATTVFFNHRSLQEFLVANAIVDMSMAPGFQTKNLYDCLRLLNEEIGNFLIGGAGESKIIEGAILNWFPAFREMYYPELSVVAMRMLVAFMAVRPDLQIELAEQKEPWFDLMLFFVRNNEVSYHAKTVAAASFVTDLVKAAGNAPPLHQAATYTLFASTLRYAPAARNIAAWLTPTMIENALSKVQGKGKHTLAYFQRDSDFLFWLFLKSSRITKINGEVAVEIDVERLREHAASLSPVDLVEELKDGTEQSVVSVTAQALYRAWDIPAKRLDKLRPFFNDTSLFARMKPLETNVRPALKKEEIEPILEPKSPRPTLSLRKPVGS